MTHEIRTRTELQRMFRGPQPAQLNMKELLNSVAMILDDEVVFTKAELEKAEPPDRVTAIRTLGYTSAGDGGGALYKRVASEPSHEGKIQSADGAWWEIAEAVLDVKMFGAAVDGLTDDASAIQSAIDVANALGGGIVRVPRGTAAVSTTVNLKAKVHFYGMGREATSLKWTGGSNHVVAATDVSNWSLGRLTIDGDSDTTDVVHGFRAGGITDFEIYEATVKNVNQYGIGFQAGDIQDGIIRDLKISNVGTDGIDLKNKNDANRGLQFTDIIVEDFGQASGNTTAAGLDIRGIATLAGIHVFSTLDGTKAGVRLRPTGATHGQGGLYSSLSNFYIENTAASAGGYGVASAAELTQITNGAVKNLFVGVGFGSAGDVTATNVKAHDCDRGFHMTAVRSLAVACAVYGCGQGFRIEADDCRVVYPTSKDSTGVAYRVLSGDANAIIGRKSENDATDLSDGGTNTVVLEPKDVTHKDIAETVSASWSFGESISITTTDTANEALLQRWTSEGGRTLNLLQPDTAGGPFVWSTSNSFVWRIDGTDILTLDAAGNIQFGTHNALSGETVSGYIEIKDAGGTVRKLAVVS